MGSLLFFITICINNRFPLWGKLYEASCDGSVETVTRLLNDGATVNTTNQNGYTALHRACLYNRPYIVKALIGYSPNINLQNNSGDTPSHYASRRGYMDCVDLLLSTGHCDLG